MEWIAGRKNSGYEKLRIADIKWPIRFDCYLLRFNKGSWISAHIDPVPDMRHYRININLNRNYRGGDFVCEGVIYKNKMIAIFRPDLYLHRVSDILQGTRYMLSFGLALPQTT